MALLSTIRHSSFWFLTKFKILGLLGPLFEPPYLILKLNKGIQVESFNQLQPDSTYLSYAKNNDLIPPPEKGGPSL